MAKQLLPHLDEFIIELTNNNYSLETVKNYKRDLEIFAAFLDKNGINFKKINKKTIVLYKGFLKGGNISILETKVKENADNTGEIQIPRSKGSRTRGSSQNGLGSRSINRMLSSLRSFLRFLIDFDYKTPIPPDALKLIKTERKESQVAEFTDLVKLVEFPSTFEKQTFNAKRNRAILELLFSTGMRISELVSLNLEDLNLSPDRRYIKQGKIYVMGKGKKQRFVYLTDRAKSHLEAYLVMRNDPYPALFIPTRGTRAATKDSSKVRLSARYIQNRIILYRRLLGVIVPTSAHSLRHGFATYLAEKGASPVAIQHLLGHESLQTTTRYVHASDRFAEKTHREFHPLK